MTFWVNSRKTWSQISPTVKPAERGFLCGCCLAHSLPQSQGLSGCTLAPPSSFCHSFKTIWDSEEVGGFLVVSKNVVEMVEARLRTMDLSSNLGDLMWPDVQPESEVVWNAWLKLFFFLMMWSTFSSYWRSWKPHQTKWLKVSPRQKEESNVDVLGSQQQRSKKAIKPLRFIRGLTVWKSVVAVSLHVHGGVQVLPGGGRISSCSACGTFGRGSDAAEMANQNPPQ